MTAKPVPDEATVGTVARLLAAAALPASETEVLALARSYPVVRASVDALYTAPGVRYADPALRFQAEATLTDWAS
ncbi:MAG TPA: hypothetical protein VG756_18075 [Pseudonocardiaceae bacterium]|jgi:hypothetical protein|nr:hypothetical protein [Pseudonocardiaceae bacterium]